MKSRTVTDFYTPLFYREGDLLVFVTAGFIACTESDALLIGDQVAAHVERLSGAEFTGEVLHVDEARWYLPARLGEHNVAILSGPSFTKATAGKTG